MLTVVDARRIVCFAPHHGDFVVSLTQFYEHLLLVDISRLAADEPALIIRRVESLSDRRCASSIPRFMTRASAACRRFLDIPMYFSREADDSLARLRKCSLLSQQLYAPCPPLKKIDDERMTTSKTCAMMTPRHSSLKLYSADDGASTRHASRDEYIYATQLILADD